MKLKSIKAEKDSNGTKYVNLIATEMDIIVLHGDLKSRIDTVEKEEGVDQDRDERRKRMFDVIHEAFKLLRPS